MEICNGTRQRTDINGHVGGIMTDGLPDNFNERWGKMETKIDFMKEKLDKVDPTDIKNLKQDMTRIKGIGGTIFAGLIVGLGWAWRKIINGG